MKSPYESVDFFIFNSVTTVSLDMNLTLSIPTKEKAGDRFQAILVGQLEDSLYSFKPQLQVATFQDADTRQVVMLIPSLSLTSYGNTEEKALQMMDLVLGDFFGNLARKPKTIDKQCTICEEFEDDSIILKKFPTNALPGTFETKKLSGEYILTIL